MGVEITLPKISLVTPSYNQGEYLEECIDSILSQNYPNLEYIIMDGGSSDNSVEIIGKYAKHLTYWRSRPDDGHYSAVLEGFNRSSGEIMGWLNSDDMFHPEGLFIIGETFARHANVDFITGRRVGFDAYGNLLSYGFEKQTWCRERLLDASFVDRHLFVMQEATYWRRTLWDRAGASLDLSFDLAADFELWARFSRFSRLHTVDALLAGYRFHGETQRSQQHRVAYLAQCKAVIEREKEIASELPACDAVPPPLIGVGHAGSSLQVMVREPLPSISIVTPSYNQGQFLEECIDSILSQNYPNLEYIIMDGGSSDNSVEIIKKYEKYLTYWQSQPDGGQYAAISEGFKKASGEVMAWLNSDDKYHDRALFAVAYLFAVNNEIDWLVGRPTSWGKEGELTDIYETLPTYSRFTFLEGKYNAPFIQQESSFWRRSLWDRAGGFVRADLEYAGDLELWLRFFRFAELYTVDALLGGYRGHGNQKGLLHMDRYVAEAEALITAENELVKSGAAPRLLPAPEPLRISSLNMKTFFNLNLPAESHINISAHQIFEYFQRKLVSQGEMAAHASALEVALRDRETTITDMQQRLERLDQLESSLSWRLTAPLRKILDALRR